VGVVTIGVEILSHLVSDLILPYATAKLSTFFKTRVNIDSYSSIIQFYVTNKLNTF